MQNRKTWYLFGTTSLILLGILGEVLGHNKLQPDTFARSLSLGLSEAFLVSGLLAIVVDPFLKQQIQKEGAWSGLFAFLNDRAPQGLRHALRDLATCDVYFPKTTWTLSFDWDRRHPGVLALTIEVHSIGENISRQPHRLDRRLWVLASTGDLQSKYLRYAVICPEAFESMDVRGDALESSVTVLGDGSLELNEAAVTKRRSVPPGKIFEVFREAVMYRHQTGHIPLQHSRFGEKLQVILRGKALSDIDVRLSHPDVKNRKKPTEWKRKAGSIVKPEMYEFRRITPGQATIVSWKPNGNGDARLADQQTTSSQVVEMTTTLQATSASRNDPQA